jgi:uncharacterized protein
MQLDLTRYRQPVSQFGRTFSPQEVEQDGDAYQVVAPVQVDLEIHKDKDRFRLVGTAKTELELACSRCLEAFRIPFDGAIDVRFLPVSELTAEDEKEVEEEDLDTSYYRDDQIDLNELLREQFYLALPMKPLCREECAGLCSQCGTNLNTGACLCTSQWENPRLAPLKGLKSEAQSPEPKD